MRPAHSKGRRPEKMATLPNEFTIPTLDAWEVLTVEVLVRKELLRWDKDENIDPQVKARMWSLFEKIAFKKVAVENAA
jgi:hypothetical protein